MLNLLLSQLNQPASNPLNPLLTTPTLANTGYNPALFGLPPSTVFNNGLYADPSFFSTQPTFDPFSTQPTINPLLTQSTFDPFSTQLALTNTGYSPTITGFQPSSVFNNTPYAYTDPVVLQPTELGLGTTMTGGRTSSGLPIVKAS